jgi:hypothetical protein
MIQGQDHLVSFFKRHGRQPRGNARTGLPAADGQRSGSGIHLVAMADSEKITIRRLELSVELSEYFPAARVGAYDAIWAITIEAADGRLALVLAGDLFQRLRTAISEARP